jgi:hypothetical protein
VHLLSVISPVADDVGVVFLPLLPAGLYELLADLGIRLVEVPEEEYATLGCNVLAVRPGVVVVASSHQPAGGRGRVHAIPLREVGENSPGSPPHAPGAARARACARPPSRLRPRWIGAVTPDLGPRSHPQHHR